MSNGETFGERGSRRRQMRRVTRRIDRLSARINSDKGLLFDRVRLGALQRRHMQLQHDYTHRV